MKYFLAALSGMVLTLCVFVGGAAFAIKYLSAEPVPVQRVVAPEAVMPTEPERVNTERQDFERVERQTDPEPLPQDRVIGLDAEPMPEFDPAPMPEIDDLTTASVGDTEALESEPKPIESPATSSNHVAWCSDRYRSYRAESNSYTSFNGDFRPCISPFSGANANAEEGGYIEASAAEPADPSAGELSSEHIETCYSRYRSYRPEDNSYQPYGGGPRQQCQ